MKNLLHVGFKTGGCIGCLNNFIIVSSWFSRLLALFGVGVRIMIASLLEPAFFGEVAVANVAALARERVLGPGKDSFNSTTVILYN